VKGCISEATLQGIQSDDEGSGTVGSDYSQTLLLLVRGMQNTERRSKEMETGSALKEGSLQKGRRCRRPKTD
jgi:hypothetical protein